MNLRSLPRVFVPGASSDGPISLPAAEIDKLRKVLRLAAGSEIAVLPNDGSLIRCRFEAKQAFPIERVFPVTEAELRLTVAQALPKGDKLDEIIRSCTEIGVARFLLFQSDRSVVRWDAKKTDDRVRRIQTIAMEACEVSFRTILPEIELRRDLAEVLASEPEAMVLSEKEGIFRHLSALISKNQQLTTIAGPEGGWSPRELDLIGDRGVTLGPRVLRVDHAAAAAAAILLLSG